MKKPTITTTKILTNPSRSMVVSCFSITLDGYHTFFTKKICDNVIYGNNETRRRAWIGYHTFNDKDIHVYSLVIKLTSINSKCLINELELRIIDSFG